MNLIRHSKEQAQESMERFLRNFSHVPEERLNWRPSPEAKSALQVAAHTACHMARFALMMRERRLPQPDCLEALLAAWREEEEAVTSPAEMEAIFREGTQAVTGALDSMTESDLALILDSGKGWSMPMSRLVELPAWHITLHLGQIDYLQTCWGDLEIYV